MVGSGHLLARRSVALSVCCAACSFTRTIVRGLQMEASGVAPGGLREPLEARSTGRTGIQRTLPADNQPG
jgi:hypothetical protein